jgi:hypothetical protein
MSSYSIAPFRSHLLRKAVSSERYVNRAGRSQRTRTHRLQIIHFQRQSEAQRTLSFSHFQARPFRSHLERKNAFQRTARRSLAAPPQPNALQNGSERRHTDPGAHQHHGVIIDHVLRPGPERNGVPNQSQLEAGRRRECCSSIFRRGIRTSDTPGERSVEKARFLVS